MHRGDSEVWGVVRCAWGVSKEHVSDHASAWAGSLYAVSVGSVRPESLHGACAVYDALLSTVRLAGFSEAPGSVIGTLKCLSPVPGGEDDVKTEDGRSSMQARIARLHSKLKEDFSVRGQLDCYLLAIDYNRRAPLEWMVLDYVDTFHYWNLPDVIGVLRQTIIGLCPSHYIQKLFNMVLCGKRYRRLISTNDMSCQLSAAMVNILHGLILGLYPFNERRLDLEKRAWLAGRIRDVLTGGNHVQFISAHPQLMCLALIEYIVNVVEDFCPVEWGLIGVSSSGKSQCLSTCEAFREGVVAIAVDVVGSADAFWTRLDNEAGSSVNTLVKFFKSAVFYQHHVRSSSAGSAEYLPMAISSRVIQNSASLFGQLKAAYPKVSYREAEALEDIWTTVYMRRLPAYTTMKQMNVLDKNSTCDFRERELYTFPICLACCLRRVDVLKGMFRYDCVSSELVCNECMTQVNVVHVNLLGRVLYVRDRAIVLCDKCLRPKCWDQVCGCDWVDTATEACCFMCDNRNVFATKDIVDLDRLQMRTVSFCYKHAISCVLSENTVYDMQSLQDEMKGRTFRFSLA